MKLTTTLKQTYLGLNMEIYLPLMDDIDYLVNELCETRETIYKLILDLSYYGQYFEDENNYKRQLVLKASELLTISKVNDIDIYTLQQAFNVMAYDCLPSTEFVVISL